MSSEPAYDIVVPTTGRPSLRTLLDALAGGTGPRPGRIVLVDDRRGATPPLLPDGAPTPLAHLVRVVPGRAAGPAAARNDGVGASRSPWVAFLDDDVVPGPTWAADLAADLVACGPDVGGSQGRIEVPVPPGRRATDWERNVAGLEHAQWATADLAYRRRALEVVGGFDERFPRAYREDADLGLRVLAAGWSIVRGRRLVRHPVRPAPWHVSVGKQAGNIDDALMDRLHGPGWRARAGAPAGRRRWHIAVTGSAAVALLGAAAGNRRLAAAAATAWLAGTADFARRRIVPGPRTAGEVAAMVATSTAVPPVATAAWLLGLVRARRIAGPVRRAPWADRRATEAVLLDRDGTIVVDVPYNGDPARVEPVPGARAALDRLRAAGLPLALVSNQSGIGRGLLTRAQVDAVNARVEELLGPFDAVLVCPHTPDDGCECRKPQPGMVAKAAAELGVAAEACVLIGDIGADVEAARAAGARAVLVPTPVTRPEEVAAAPTVAPDLAGAVELVLAGGAA